MRPGVVFLPLIVPIGLVVVFLLVPANARIPAFLAIIGLTAALVLSAKRRQAGKR